jgi:hypothetical protein
VRGGASPEPGRVGGSDEREKRQDQFLRSSSGTDKSFCQGRSPERARAKLWAMGTRPRVGRRAVRVELKFGGCVQTAASVSRAKIREAQSMEVLAAGVQLSQGLASASVSEKLFHQKAVIVAS